MSDSPLTLTQDIYCPATDKFIPLEVVQTDSETDAQTVDRFFAEKAAIEASCAV